MIPPLPNVTAPGVGDARKPCCSQPGLGPHFHNAQKKQHIVRIWIIYIHYYEATPGLKITITFSAMTRFSTVLVSSFQTM